MKKPLIPALLFLAVTPVAHAQGSLTPPPGGPAPSMRSLQEIWDKIDTLQTELQALREQNELGQRYNQDFYIHYANGGSLPWQSGNANNSPDNVGSNTSLAFGPDGLPAIAHHNATTKDVEFARFNGTSWTNTTVDSAGHVGDFVSLAIGPDGQPAIAYADGGNTDLKFARFNGTTWGFTVVDRTGNVGYYTSLAFGPDGQPAISYYDQSNSNLKFARMGLYSPTP